MPGRNGEEEDGARGDLSSWCIPESKKVGSFITPPYLFNLNIDFLFLRTTPKRHYWNTYSTSGDYELKYSKKSDLITDGRQITK